MKHKSIHILSITLLLSAGLLCATGDTGLDRLKEKHKNEETVTSKLLKYPPVTRKQIQNTEQSPHFCTICNDDEKPTTSDQLLYEERQKAVEKSLQSAQKIDTTTWQQKVQNGLCCAGQKTIEAGISAYAWLFGIRVIPATQVIPPKNQDCSDSSTKSFILPSRFSVGKEKTMQLIRQHPNISFAATAAILAKLLLF